MKKRVYTTIMKINFFDLGVVLIPKDVIKTLRLKDGDHVSVSFQESTEQ